MKISREWLQRYFEKPLPDATPLADALTFHAFEIDSIENDILDVKITANRGHDCLNHRGIAKELSAILEIPMKGDPLRQEAALTPKTEEVSVHIQDSLCTRYIAGYVRGVKVGPSPDWLRKAVENIGQRSINNVVDATNFVMFDIGQPLHAFDAGQLQKNTENGSLYKIGVRRARAGEKLLALDDREYTLTDAMLVITDHNSDAGIGIAGVKGGKPAGISEATTDIIIESANFDGITTRKIAAALKLRTDASSRYEQVISPELCAYGMRAVADLIVQVAGGEIVGFADVYPQKQQQKAVRATTAEINAILGSEYAEADVASALTRLDLEFTKQADAFVVEPPLERLDLTIPEDIAEEVGRLYGYDKIEATPLPPMPSQPEVNPNFYAAEHAREEYIAQGYSEVFTSVFADKGERVIANKVDGVRPFLRTTLVDGLKDAYEKNRLTKDLLGLAEVKLFEIGTIWKGEKEHLMLGIVDKDGVREEALSTMQRGVASMHYENVPLSQAERFQPFSKYPFIVRDIALWTSAEVKPEEILKIIRTNAGDLLVRSEKFDEFKKGEKISYAFRLVFQSFDTTLTDLDANGRMESIAKALKATGFEIR